MTHITTTATARERRTTQKITVIALPARPGGEPPSVQWHMWAAMRIWNGRLYDIWRTRAAQPVLPVGAIVITRERLPVVEEDRQNAFCHRYVDDFFNRTGDALDDAIRDWRGDPNMLPHTFDAPFPMAFDEAMEAAALDMQSEHLFYSVDQVHGRWVYSTGLGGHKRQHGSAATREEALVLGQAHMWAAWHERFKYIRRRRLGVMSFGVPIPAPGPNAFYEGEGESHE